MCEGIAWREVMESPVVIHLAQRPGRYWDGYSNEQGDLDVARYAGPWEISKGCTGTRHSGEACQVGAKAFIWLKHIKFLVLLQITILNFIR